VNDLDRALEQLRHEVDFPPTPPVAARVAARITARRRRRRTALLLAPALPVLAAGIVAAASPAARDAFADLFGIRGASVRRVPTLPQLERRPLPLGQRVSIAEAERLAGFRVLIPRQLGQPDAVYYSSFPAQGQVNLVYRARPALPSVPDLRAGLVVGEFRSAGAAEDEGIIGKIVGPGGVQRLRVAGRPALWVTGRHGFMYGRGALEQERFLLVRGNVLLIQRLPLLVRIESRLPRRETVRLGRSLVPIGRGR
jgi:hypothetical protein